MNAVVSGALLVGVLAGCSAQDEEPGTADESSQLPEITCPQVPTSSGVASEPVAGPGNEAIEVVESGFYYDDLDDDMYQANTNLYFTAIFENTSDLIAKDVEVIIQGFINGEEARSRHSQPLEYVLPGGQMPTVVSFVQDWETEGGRYDDVEITWEVGEWWQPGNGVYQPYEVTSVNAQIPSPDSIAERDSSEQPREHIEFDAYSCAPERVPAAVISIFRSAEGELIAGVVGPYTEQCQPNANVYEPGARFFTPGWNHYCHYALIDDEGRMMGVDGIYEDNVTVEAFPIIVYSSTRKPSGNHMDGVALETNRDYYGS